jgi:acetolactate synthase-1/2/3 large subunit
MLERTGAQILVDQLKIHGVETVFCVPGESYLHVLDALYDVSETIRLISCRQEGGAAYAAEAYGRLTGKPGICFVTRGPGASNASIGVHTAFQGSTPMILFIGQVARGHSDREAFQEIDYRRMFGQMAKWVSQIDDPRRIPEFLSHAFHLAMSGRQGPVVLALPEDMLAERASVPDAEPYRQVRSAPHPGDMAGLRQMLATAKRPLMMVGVGGWTPEAALDIRAFAKANHLPTIAAFRSQDLLDNHADYYIGATGVGGNPALLQRVKDSDFLLVVGARLDQLTTAGYAMVDIPRPKQKMVHIYPDPAELGRVYQADLLINATMPEFATAARTLPSVDGNVWADWTRAGREEYLRYIEPTEVPGLVNFGQILAYLNKHLPAETIVTNGAGNYTAWCHRFYEFSVPRTQLAPISGAMGYGVPAALAAKLVHPERIVLSFAGDGCFLMNGQELATAMMYGLNIIFIVVNNNMMGTIRMHQERQYPGRVSGTSLVNPDFAAYARAFGAYGEVVEKTGDFPDAFERAQAAGRPALLELRVDPEALTPTTTLSGTREAALARKKA